MGKPAARITDMHTCAMVTGLVPHVGGPILPICSVNVITGGINQARVTDMAFCAGGPDVIIQGSASVMVNNLPAARMGDMTTHGGVIITGCPTVLIGDAGGAAPSGAIAPPGKPCMKSAAASSSPFVKP